METITDIDAAAEALLRLSEIHLDSINGAVPIVEQYDELMTSRAADNEALAEIPEAFAAYLDQQQNQWG